MKAGAKGTEVVSGVYCYERDKRDGDRNSVSETEQHSVPALLDDPGGQNETVSDTASPNCAGGKPGVGLKKRSDLAPP